jgi:hypothetical protein
MAGRLRTAPLLKSPLAPTISRQEQKLIKGQAADDRELFEFTVEPFVMGGFLLSIRYSGDGLSNVTGAGVWPSIEKAKEVAEQSARRLLHDSTVTWQE